MAATPLAAPFPPAVDMFEAEADTLRAMAHPKRLMILSQLGARGRSVSELASVVGISLPNASQHLRVLRDRGIVQSERVGQVVKYRLTSPEFQACCARVRQVIAAGMSPPLMPRSRSSPAGRSGRPLGAESIAVRARRARPTH